MGDSGNAEFANISVANSGNAVLADNHPTATAISVEPSAQLKEKVAGEDGTAFPFAADNGQQLDPTSEMEEKRDYISQGQKAIIILLAFFTQNILKAHCFIYYISFFVLVTSVSGSQNHEGPAPNNDNKYDWIIFIVCCVVMGVVFLLCLGLRYLWLSYLHGEPRRMIERLPSLRFVGGGVGAFGTTHCGICQTELVEGDSLRILPCAHIFHARCLIDMVSIGRTAICPECRHTFGTIAPPDPEVPLATWLAQLG